jgi:hypothetical protein
MKKGMFIVLLMSTMHMFSQVEEPRVISLLSSKTIITTELKDLDATHVNLLNPNVSDSNFKEVLNSWTQLHQELNSFLKGRKFRWETKSKKIKMFNRFYFDNEGNISVYAFRFFNKISPQKENEFLNLMKDFTKNHKIRIKRREKFAQCGKIALPNNL